MIRSFRDQSTRDLFNDEFVIRFGLVQRVARRRLLAVHADNNLNALRTPPGNRLEALKGDRQGQYSIRINGQWRICFRWQDGDAYDVEIVDYHSRLDMARKARKLDPITPGEMLKEEFMVPFGLTMNEIARALAVPPGRISEIVRGRRAITADTALRLGKYFGMSAQFWLNLQTDYDLQVAEANWPKIEPRVQRLPAANRRHARAS